MANATNAAGFSRRQALTAAVSLTAATIPTVADAKIIDPHHAWLEEWRAHTDIVTEADEDADLSRAKDRIDELTDLIVRTPAMTGGGFTAKLRFLRADSDNFNDNYINTEAAAEVFDQLDLYFSEMVS